MKLTGKAKEDFKEWYKTQPLHTPINTPYAVFMGQRNSMKWGVIVNWADTVDVVVDIQPVIDYNESVYAEVIEYLINVIPLNKPVEKIHSSSKKTREEAQKKAIQELNKIINE